MIYSLRRILSACLLIATFVSLLPANDREDDDVGDLMERVHSGRRSPLRQIERQLAENQPNWLLIEQQLPGFGRMVEALRRTRDADVRDSADGYADAVNQLAKTVRNRNLAESRKAVRSLKESCGDCHYKGGPGGKLEDD